MLRAIAFGLVGLVVIESRFLFVCDVTTVTAPTRPSCWTFWRRTNWREADMSGVISEGGERLRVFLDGETRAT